MTRYVLDAGPLVALLTGSDSAHAWAKDTLAAVEPPLVTCEAVVSEACFLVADLRNGTDSVLALVTGGVLRIEFALTSEATAVRKLMAKYADVPMSLADACLVRMTEIDAGLKVITLDEDFLIYRRHGRQAIPVIMP